jgi:hypothetical protein
MTPDQKRANEALVRGLRESLNHNLPADMRHGIHKAIELYSGKPEAQSAPPDTGPRDVHNQPIIFTARVTLNGQPTIHPSTPALNPWRPF